MIMFNTDGGESAPEHVLDWCRNLVRTLTDGGVWGIPRSGTVFKVDKANKQLILMVTGEDDGADFLATQHVFRQIGWDVVKNEETPA